MEHSEILPNGFFACAKRHKQENAMRHGVVEIAGRLVGDGQPAFVIAEIGINHNGSVELAKKMIDGAALAGCDAVKFQKRTPEKCVPIDQWYLERDTPWGRMTYIDYRHRIEFGEREYAEIDRYCRERGILWFASCWDEDSVDFIEQFAPPAYKAASASLTDLDLLMKMKATGRPLIISTGMSTMEEIEIAVETVFESMKKALAKGDRIELRGFGVFNVRPRKTGIGRNPRTGAEVTITPGKAVRFKPGKELHLID